LSVEKNIRLAKISDFIGLLKKWQRAFFDDVLAEEGAITLYMNHIENISSDLGFKLNKQKDNFISTEKLTTKLMNELGLSEENANWITLFFADLIIGRNESIIHIVNEEKEHKEEFLQMISNINKIVSALEDFRAKTLE